MGIGRALFVAGALALGAFSHTIDDAVASIPFSHTEIQCPERYMPKKLNKEAKEHFYAGALNHAARKLDKAVKEFEIAAKLDPESALPNYRLGLLYDDMAAINAETTIISRERGNAKTEKESWILANENWNRAAEYLKQAIEIEPCYPESYFALGRVYFRLNDCENAIFYSRKFIQLQPDSPLAEHAMLRIDSCNERAENKEIFLNTENINFIE